MSIHVSDILALHKACIKQWKAHGVSHDAIDEFLALVEKNHAFNYQLWHAEDKARRKDKGDTFVCEAKRAIDGFNQKRNDYMELMDNYLFQALKPASHECCAVHSETPGMMIDRLSILALKHYHMNLQATREDADEAHRAQCQQKLEVISEQLKQLGLCLEVLLDEVIKQQRTFRLYRQMKMYNSPTLNPELYVSS